ncbi:MAG: hypothetical protein QW757_06045 [Candidatus Woesearchaeota archaeon]
MNLSELIKVLEKGLTSFLYSYDKQSVIKITYSEKNVEILIGIKREIYEQYLSHKFNLFQAAASYIPNLLVPKHHFYIDLFNSAVIFSKDYYYAFLYLHIKQGQSFVKNNTRF